MRTTGSESKFVKSIQIFYFTIKAVNKKKLTYGLRGIKVLFIFLEFSTD